MSLQGHVAELSRRHQSLEKQIEEERVRPSRNLLRIGELKRKKLQLKDEMERLQN